MAKAGWSVTVLEKNDMPGGRARKLEADGFTFDMGPSWYWMPDVFERFFQQFGKSVSDYYSLTRLDPSYRVYWPGEAMDIPADYGALKELFERIEAGSAAQLDKFLSEAAFKYKIGMQKLVYKPGLSATEFIDWDVISGALKMDILTSMKKHVAAYFKDARLKELLEFPVLFLGALPENTPALYSLMNYADIKGGTWFPSGGMYSIVEAMYSLAVELGVNFQFKTNVLAIDVQNGKATKVVTDKGYYQADTIIGAADYHHIERQLLPASYQTYTPKYWDSRVMAPGCLLYYVGLNKRLQNIRHHSLFFDVPFQQHAKEIYTSKEWPSAPLFYVSATTVSDPSMAPDGCENLFFLIPVAAGLKGDTEELREEYFKMIIERFEKHIGQSVADSIVYKRTYANSDFIKDYNSFKGNAYGLANTLMQTAVLKPSIRSKKVSNLFYAGQLTVPGPGVPPCLISGELAARQVIKEFAKLEAVL
jgi:phytoene desaturase